jgi:hypothetical protein
MPFANKVVDKRKAERTKMNSPIRILRNARALILHMTRYNKLISSPLILRVAQRKEESLIREFNEVQKL